MVRAYPIVLRAEEGALAYVTAPSIGHEIGVTIAGIASMLLASLLFWIWWTFKLKADIRKEQARIEDLRRRGLWNKNIIPSRQIEDLGKEKVMGR
ncbi:hypothetical protein AOQ84DRAFT_372227 [Glonium stellatum]|uniref:Uncharacterized protein n=1 Tax=Glonium stellatum TaxID=574774 RepID=A0A8E2FA52_9PEZI|nr:hypothetical protein AOQ84DRAFT_372227 [Glonium stellatum]